jgi:hypothetical protein
MTLFALKPSPATKRRLVTSRLDGVQTDASEDVFRGWQIRNPTNNHTQIGTF